MTDGFVTLSDIDKARHALAGKVVRTLTVQSASLSETIGAPVHLKLEHRQITGSFKLRGATNALSNLTAKEKQQGVVAASDGQSRPRACVCRASGGCPCRHLHVKPGPTEQGG